MTSMADTRFPQLVRIAPGSNAVTLTPNGGSLTRADAGGQLSDLALQAIQITFSPFD
jgi:hypothetical protein